MKQIIVKRRTKFCVVKNRIKIDQTLPIEIILEKITETHNDVKILTFH